MFTHIFIYSLSTSPGRVYLHRQLFRLCSDNVIPKLRLTRRQELTELGEESYRKFYWWIACLKAALWIKNVFIKRIHFLSRLFLTSLKSVYVKWEKDLLPKFLYRWWWIYRGWPVCADIVVQHHTGFWNSTVWLKKPTCISHFRQIAQPLVCVWSSYTTCVPCVITAGPWQIPREGWEKVKKSPS